MGRFARLVDTPKGMAAFRAKYRVSDNVEFQHCKLGEWLVLTWHDINWVYNSQKGKYIGYYFKYRVPFVRLISCILELNKGMDKDFFIVLGEWHNGLHCPT